MNHSVSLRRNLDTDVISYGTGECGRLSAEDYARARTAVPCFCLDGLVCGVLRDGRRVVMLLRRRSEGRDAGPFRGEPWVIGGKWDFSSELRSFVATKARSELFGGEPVALSVEGPIGDKLFITPWAAGDDGPFGLPGLTVQRCYRVVLDDPIDPERLAPDSDHDRVMLVAEETPLEGLHPYIEDVIRLSGWFQGDRLVGV